MATQYPMSGASELRDGRLLSFHLQRELPGAPSHPTLPMGVFKGWMPEMDKEDEGLRRYVKDVITKAGRDLD